MADNTQRPFSDSRAPSSSAIVYSPNATPDDARAPDAHGQEIVPAPPQVDDEAQSCILVFLLYALITRLHVAENASPRIVPHESDGQVAPGNLVSAPPYGGPPPLPAHAWTGPTRRTSRARARGLLGGPGIGENGHLGQPPPYALSINETTWSFLTDLLELRVSLATYSPSSDGINVPTTIIDEHTLRALFMQAITWYVDRECIPLAGVQVAFIGRRVGEEVNTQYPCLPIGDVREIAEQLPLDGVSITALANFDPYMFCAGDFLPAVCSHWWLFCLVFLCVLASGAFAILIARIFLVVWPAIIFVVGEDRVKLLMKIMFKLFAAMDVFEDYVLHVGIVIFGFIEYAIHFGN